jgi:hypothetical protein
MSWQPPIPWKVIARRGFGVAYVAAFYTAPTYAEAKVMALKVLCGSGGWESVEILQGTLTPRPKKSKPRPTMRKKLARQDQTMVLFEPDPA